MVIHLFKKWFGKDTHLEEVKNSVTIISSRDIKAIAGDDVMATQLDLARAYIEIGKINLAKQILQHVIKNGSQHEQHIAQQLMAYL